MKISTILDHIDSGSIALPEFQRGYVWNRNQVRSLLASLYRRHPVGGLLVWATESQGASYRGEGELPLGQVKLLLDGQQRMTSLYGIVRGKPPKFFDGNEKAFTDLFFNLENEEFSFYQPMRMKNDPLWIDVSSLMMKGNNGLGEYVTRLSQIPEHSPRTGVYVGRLSTLLGIREIGLHVHEITGADKTIDVVVNIFNTVNSGGTKLSKGDLALAKICSNWPDAREAMKVELIRWKKAGYDFNLDWLLRSVNTVLTGEARFTYLHNQGAEEIKGSLTRATKAIDTILNHISGQLGLDHDRVLFGKFAIPIMARYLDQRKSQLSANEIDKLLFWYVQAGMWGRFSGSTETMIDQDLAAIEEVEGGIDRLLEQMRLWHGSLQVKQEHFYGWSIGARFYPLLYMLTRMGESKDWGSGLPLKASMLGKMNKLEVHHIFPKSKLYDSGFKRPQVNALANFCFQTKSTNLAISDRLPEDYFPEIEAEHPGALASQWIPMDRELWRVDNYQGFLIARQKLLAEEANRRLESLLHGDTRWFPSPSLPSVSTASAEKPAVPIGGIASDTEEQELESLNKWVGEQDLPMGIIAYDLSDEETGEQQAVFDLAWPDGLQPELSEPVAVLLDEGTEVIVLANERGFRCFTTPESFQHYVERELLSPVPVQ